MPSFQLVQIKSIEIKFESNYSHFQRKHVWNRRRVPPVVMFVQAPKY